MLSRAFQAPGRVNLIGEHTDYTGGRVLPMAIPFTTTAVLVPAEADYHFKSTRFSHVHRSSSGDRGPAVGDWSDYPVGVLRQLQMRGVEFAPFTLELSGDVPLGAGLSSSASVEVATAMALLWHAGLSLSNAEIATMCRAAENEFVGSPCGIMDQFVITAAEEGHALLLNTGDLSYELLPMNAGRLAECSVVIANSMIQHSNSDGDYGVRRQEVEEGQTALKAKFPELVDLSGARLAHLNQARSMMSPEAYLRCRHIITENERVLEARSAMLAGDPIRLGSVMTAAHASERDDFACSIPEIDFLVEAANTIEGCYGARLTGGGFGGCTVNLVQASAVEAFKQKLADAYLEKFSLAGEFYVCAAVDGAARRAGTRASAFEIAEQMRPGIVL
jgi:galactokinase